MGFKHPDKSREFHSTSTGSSWASLLWIIDYGNGLGAVPELCCPGWAQGPAPQGGAAPQVGGLSQELCEVPAGSVTQDVQGQGKMCYPALIEKEKEEENETEKKEK